MIELSRQLGDEATEFGAVLAVWILMSFSVGSAVADAIAFTPLARPYSLQASLVVGGLVVAVLVLVNWRPPILRAVALLVVDLILELAVLLPVVIFVDDARSTVALLELATATVAVWVVFAGGGRLVADQSRAILHRLTRRPPAGR